jgi:thiamine kinase-like enzyme
VTFVLSTKNAIEYLTAVGVGGEFEREKIYLQGGKNFNLLVKGGEDKYLTLKQERRNRGKQSPAELVNEWYLRSAIAQFPALAEMGEMIPQLLHCDRENSIIAIEYLANHSDLLYFYHRQRDFDPRIGKYIGKAIGKIHQLTYQQEQYREFFQHRQPHSAIARLTLLIPTLQPLTPESYSQLPGAGIKFISLCQRYESLTTAIQETIAAIQPRCLTHNDFKLNNILLANDWENSEKLPLKIIDWERCGWGDPAIDIGGAIASYLQIWIESMVVNPAISIEDSLKMATIPLSKIQPSIESMMRGYLDEFPQLTTIEPQFLPRVIQWAGIALLQQIQATIQYRKSFDNTGIYTLQIAKTLLCYPERSIITIFGVEEIG